MKKGFKNLLIQRGGRKQTQPHDQDLAVLCADLVVYPGYSTNNEEQKLLTANIRLGSGLGSSEVGSR